MEGLSEYNLVEKSKALVWSNFKNYTAGELRLLEVYLSKINPREPESATVTFTMQEYCKLLGLKLKSKDLKAQLQHFLENTVSIPTGDGGYDIYTLFAIAQVRFDKERKTYMISIRCNPLLQPVFFDIAEKGYVKYRLKYTINMKSQYSILLYSILKDWLNMGSDAHVITVDRLREQLGAESKSYEQFKVFRARVLDPAVKEINNISEIDVSYEKIAYGTSVHSLEFNIAYKATPVIDAEATETNGSEKKPSHPVRRTLKSVYGDADWNTIAPELDAKQCLSLAKLVEKKLKDEYPTLLPEKKKDAVLNIISNAYQMVLGDKTDIENPCGYLTAAIKNNELGEYATFGVDYMQ